MSIDHLLEKSGFEKFSDLSEVACWLKFTEQKLRDFRIATICIDLRKKCESPIEVELGCELVAQCPSNFDIVTQYKWRRFRMDFAIVDRNPQKTIRALIECDSATFHRTPNQIANDKRKDDAASKDGLRLFRFTSKEIFHDAWDCAAYVWSELK